MGCGCSGGQQKHNRRQEENAGRYRNKHFFGILASRGADASRFRPALVRAGLRVPFTHPVAGHGRHPLTLSTCVRTSPALPPDPWCRQHCLHSLRYRLNQHFPDQASPPCGTENCPVLSPSPVPLHCFHRTSHLRACCIAYRCPLPVLPHCEQRSTLYPPLKAGPGIGKHSIHMC